MGDESTELRPHVVNLMTLAAEQGKFNNRLISTLIGLAKLIPQDDRLPIIESLEALVEVAGTSSQNLEIALKAMDNYLGIEER